ncbi:hypothetical protein PH191_20845 [Actinomycetospora callitridis]|nr:hypothetical protein [Actinomycetospora callitridis]
MLLVIGVLSAGIGAGQVWPRARSAAYGGFWAGLLAFFALVLGLHTVTSFGPLPKGFVDLVPPPVGVLIGAGVGALVASLYLGLRADKRVAMPLGWQTFGALGLLYLFLIWPEVREYIGWLAVGTAAASSVAYALLRDQWPRSGGRKESQLTGGIDAGTNMLDSATDDNGTYNTSAEDTGAEHTGAEDTGAEDTGAEDGSAGAHPKNADGTSL